ncbi:MAG: hypothetical protein EP305_06155, partial [Bacteroidetes bacterium]
MKKLLYFLLLVFSVSQMAMASGGGGGPTIPCTDADPFCTQNTYAFPNSTNTSAPTGPNYGCLGSEPNPVWFYMQIDVAGPMTFTITQSTTQGGAANLDVDYALWGPFTSVATGCNSITNGSSAPIGCSYSTAPTETVSIANAQLNMFYIIIITNFDGGAGYITFNQTGGSGVADCGLVTPCDMTALTATPGACNPATNTYNLTGSISFVSPPSTGTLTVTSSCGGSQTFNAPFTSPTNYTLSNLNPTGGACTVTATFSGDATCTLSQNYTSPAPCISQPCYISNMSANIGTCQTDNTFPVTGTFVYQNNPGSGSVVVTVTNSSGSYTQTFNPPFVNGQTYNFNITNCISDGSPLTVTVAFTADPACTNSVSSTSPMSCGCSADIGTFTAGITGSSSTNYVLCFGDEIDITANGDYTAPEEALDPPNAGGYEPGITWLVYSCPPTIALTPSSTPPNDWIGNDPCLLGMYSDFDMYDINDQYWINAYPPGTFTNNTVYFVPITMYNLTESLYSYVNTSLPCYDMGTPVAVQYLPNITVTTTTQCSGVTATISGGLPALNGSQFTAVPGSITPAGGSFVNTTASNGGTIAVTGLTPGAAYSFQVQDANGCPKTISGTLPAGPTLSYPQNAYCKNAANPSPTIT